MRSLFLPVLFAFLFVSCGAQVDKSEIKTYVLALQNSDSSHTPLVKKMIEDYNAEAGFRALEFSDSIDNANCPVIITKGLEKRDGKVGWGQWFSTTERDGLMVPIPGTRSTETVRYSLQVEFDEDFLKSNNKSGTNGALNVEIRKLFAHEIGHGFQFQHVPEENDIMYYDISGDKDFSTYWPRIRGFFYPDEAK
jgi:hypothetical protein